MPSSSRTSSLPTTASDAIAAAAIVARHLPTTPHFGVIPFRRDAQGAVVPGAAVEFHNCDIAWRRARAAAAEHGNVGAVVLIGSDVAQSGKVTDGVLLAQFGEVNLDALAN